MIKIGSLKGNVEIDQSVQYNLTGIGGGTAKTQGCCQISILAPGRRIFHTFHVVSDAFPIKFSGILGDDFLKDRKAVIDYEKDELRVGNIILSLEHEFKTPKPQAKQRAVSSDKAISAENPIIVHPRTETIVEVDILNPEIGQGIIPEVRIMEGVYLCRSMVTVNPNGKAITTILNSRLKMVKISALSVLLEPIEEDSQILNLNTETNQDASRLKKLEELIQTQHLNPEEKESIVKLCRDYHDIFHLEGDHLTHTTLMKHEIHLNTNIPVTARTYRYPEALKGEVKKQLDEMLEQNIIRESNSPFSSPLWIVRKKAIKCENCQAGKACKDGKCGKPRYRIVIDFRHLNNSCIGDNYQIPNITDILDKLGNAKYFTTLDFFSGFTQVELAEEDKFKTSFSTCFGQFEYNRMPQGLKTSPARFQRLLDSVLSGLEGARVFTYIDDVALHATSLQEHDAKVRNVFDRLRTHVLKLNPGKCVFLSKSVVYLGHLLTPEGVSPNPDLVKVVKDYPACRNPRDIKSFLGLCSYYRKFIENFSKIALPLTSLLKADVKFLWGPTQQEAFENLKERLTSKPILQYPKWDEPFILTTDASNQAVGAILSQGVIPQDLPIAYASRKFNKAEVNYSTTEKELAAIIFGVKHFRPYLYGKKFTIVTDHRPLTYLMNVKDPGSRLIRWRLKLEEYDYEIVYKPGRQNANADCLSRIPEPKRNVGSTKESHSVPVTIAQTNVVKPGYDDYLETTSRTVIINPLIKEMGKPIDQIKDNICFFICKNLETFPKAETKLFTKLGHLEHLEKADRILNKIINVKDQNRIAYYVIAKEEYLGSVTDKELFGLLTSLRDELLKSKVQTLTIPKMFDQKNYFKYEKLRSMIRFIFLGSGIEITLVTHSPREAKPEEIPIILKENHDTPFAGHAGFQRTYKRIKAQYRWPKFKEEIRAYVQACPSCQTNKIIRRGKTRMPMVITSTARTAFQKIAMDILGPLPITENGNRFVLAVQCDLTKFSQAYALPDHEAETVARTLVNRFFSIFSMPDDILSDNGTEFCAKLMEAMARLFQIRKIRTTAYHPQSNGSVERGNATLADYLRHFVEKDETTWDEWVATAMLSYNTSVHSATNFTPFELVFGKVAQLPSSITKPPEFRYCYDDYITELTQRLRLNYELAREKLIQAKEKSKEYYDAKGLNPIEFKIGDRVLLEDEQNKPGTSKKLAKRYKRVHTVVNVNPPVNVEIKYRNKKQTVHANRLRKYVEKEA